MSYTLENVMDAWIARRPQHGGGAVMTALAMPGDDLKSTVGCGILGSSIGLTPNGYLVLLTASPMDPDRIERESLLGGRLSLRGDDVAYVASRTYPPIGSGRGREWLAGAAVARNRDNMRFRWHSHGTPRWAAAQASHSVAVLGAAAVIRRKCWLIRCSVDGCDLAVSIQTEPGGARKILMDRPGPRGPSGRLRPMAHLYKCRDGHGGESDDDVRSAIRGLQKTVIDGVTFEVLPPVRDATAPAVKRTLTTELDYNWAPDGP